MDKTCLEKNAQQLDFESMKYWWFSNTRCEFKFRRGSLVFGLNNLPIPSIQIHKTKNSELAFALFRSEVLVLILGALLSAILKWSASCTLFANFLENKSRSRQKSYTTFINSPWGISEKNMRVVFFWTMHMCHLSLGHKISALKCDITPCQKSFKRLCNSFFLFC